MRRAAGKERRAEQSSALATSRSAGGPAPADGYILVVDDDADHRELLADSLSAMGYSVEQAENGRLALDRLEEQLPALLLLDLKMPVMSGWAVLEALRQMPRASGIPVLVISAYGFEWEAELIGAAGYVGKPVDLAALGLKVQALIGQPRPALLH